ncbi:unnamed protein product, partial [Mesorhabditis belari]|uniref:G-protein coupled receptors family 1 profile domain-containing protein n=1 Tax=Mesorhabditis belari TaxID=2138241 RepID=A0AAF3FIH0_9BILA
MEIDKISEWLSYLGCVLVVFVEPLLCSIGFLLNCACVFVFISVSNNAYFRKTSLLTYLVALSICNGLQLLLSLFVIVLPAIEQFVSITSEDLMRNLLKISSFSVRYGYPLLLTVNYAAIWLLTLICAQRFQAICHPSSPWKKRLSAIRNARLAVIIVILLAIGLNIIRFWEFKYNEEDRVVTTELREHLLYKLIQEGVVYGMIVYGLPAGLLLWLNGNILALLKKDKPIASSTRRDSETRAAHLTVCVFLFFFLCSTLSASIRLFMIVAGDVVESWYWLVDLSNLLMNIFALITPILCYIFTRGFKDLFFVIRQPKAKDALVPYLEDVSDRRQSHLLLQNSSNSPHHTAQLV